LGENIFSKEDKQHNSIHRLLNMKEQNGVKKDIKKYGPGQSELA